MRFQNLAFGLLLISIVGCASFDKAAQATEDGLNRPLVAGTTQPTVGQTAQSAAAILGPWASLAGGVGMILLHEYNSSRRNKKLMSAVLETPKDTGGK